MTKNDSVDIGVKNIPSKIPIRILRVIVNVFVMAFSITCIFPVIWMVYSSFKSNDEFLRNIIGLPANPQFENYIYAFKVSKMGVYFFNSAFNSVVCVAAIVILSTFVGYFIARYKFAGRNIIYTMFIAGMLMPIYGLLVPIYLQFRALNMLDHRYTLILPYIAFGLPMAIFLIENFVRTIPVEIEEAATIDGCRIRHILFRIILPMCSPVLATVMILTFLNVWNEFPFALILINEDSLKTIPIGLTYFKGQYKIDYAKLMAALVIAMAPVVIFYLFSSKRIMEGMVAGAVKG